MAAVERFGRFGPSAFVAEHGSTIASPPTGQRRPARAAEARAHPTTCAFARGFGRYEPLGLAVGPGGALYVTLQRSGRLVRFVP